MYAKFRTVASILVIAEFTIPLLAMLALKEVLSDDVKKEKLKVPLIVSFVLTGGVALLFSLMPSFFFGSFISSSEMRAIQTLPPEHIQPLIANLTEMREAVFTSDCLRSFYIILVGTGLLLAFLWGKLKKAYAIGIILVLCLVDLWTVNKRYLNDEMFVPKEEREAPQEKSQTDELILRDTTLDYRVLNLASNTFNENETSYYHKSIGGYHAAKLRRYQEMIEAYINPEMQRLFSAVSEAGGDMTQVNGDSICPVLNMLNTKYFIFPLQGGQTVPIQNPYVYGNAWFVDQITYVDNANKEIETVGKIDLRHQAVADAKFKAQLGEAAVQDTASIVKITSYEPNRLTYDVNSGKGGVLVFSEIYYPGWTATVDGEAVELGRVNYGILPEVSGYDGDHRLYCLRPPVVDTHLCGSQSVQTEEMKKLLSLPPNLVEPFHEVTGLDAEEYFCTCDPVGHRLGSGGGTTWLLQACFEHDGAETFDHWLASEKRILIHAGGQSKRLPSYAVSGKVPSSVGSEDRNCRRICLACSCLCMRR